MKATKPNGTSVPQTNEQLARFSIIGSVASFFYAKGRLIEARRAARESAPVCQQVIAAADQTLTLGAKIIAESKVAIRESDDIIASSQALRQQ